MIDLINALTMYEKFALTTSLVVLSLSALIAYASHRVSNEKKSKAGKMGSEHAGSARGSRVLLSPEVAQAFPTEEAVNRALRSLMKK